MGADTITIEGVNKKFHVEEKAISVLEEINIQVSAGQFVSIVGASGCGKSTLLRLVGGLDTQYQGNIFLDGKKISGPSIHRGIVFQEPRLLPWLTLEQNVGFGLDGRKNGASKDEKKKLIQQHIDLVGLKGFEKVFPCQLSGGMAQRAAMARALVNRPDVLLLDEPLGALDALTRLYMQRELLKIWEKEKITMVMVTHDIEEAIYLSDKIFIFSCRPGKLKKTIRVPLARPRDRDGLDFIRIKEEILKEFHLGAEEHLTYSI